MSIKRISDLVGVSFEIAEDARNEQEDFLFNKYPFLNTLCLTQIFKNSIDKEGSFIIEAGVTSLQKVNQIPKEEAYNNAISKDATFNKNTFPPFLIVNTKGRDYDNKVFNNNTQLQITIPLIQKQMDPSISQTREKTRPLKKGVNIGDKYNPTLEGTLGAICKLKGFPGYYALSNWHVMVGLGGYNSNSEIMQPCQGNEQLNQTEAVGKVVWSCLDRYRDLALAKIYDNISIELKDANYGSIINETARPIVEDNVFCKGANGSYSGKIISENCSVRIESNKHTRNASNYYILRDQIITNKISIPGDSGALVINSKNKKVIGLIVGGDAKKYSVICRINFNTIPQNRHNNPSQNFHCKSAYLNNIEIESFI